MNKESSVDQNEVNKFNKTSEEWWDKSGEFKILHQINPIRIQYINDKIAEHFNSIQNKENDLQPLKNLNIIDVGCGGGLISVPICQLGAKVTAIDANSYNIKALSEYTKNNNLSINPINTTVEEYISNYPDQLYDVVLCLEVLEHVSNQSAFIQNLLKLLKPTGILILSTINRTIKSYAHAIIAAEYILKWVPTNTHDYSKFLKPSELYKILEVNNFHLKNLTGLKFDIITNSWYLSDDIDVNYFACVIKNSYPS